MMSEFKIHKTTGGVIHSGSWMGNEADPKTSKYGYFTPSCGSGVVYAMGSLRNIAGFREAKADAEVTCKKCLKLAAKLEEQDRAEAATQQRRAEIKARLAQPIDDHAAAVAQMRANIDAEDEERAAARRARNRTNYAPAPASADHEIESQPVKPAPFTFEYDALTGIIVADALREKAKAHRAAAKGYRTNAELGTNLQDFYTEQERIFNNNAKLLEDAADAIHAPVKAVLANEMGHAIERTEVKVRATKRAKRERSGMDSLRESLRLY